MGMVERRHRKEKGKDVAKGLALATGRRVLPFTEIGRDAEVCRFVGKIKSLFLDMLSFGY